MKRCGNLWPQIVAYGNLYAAFKKARLGKANNTQVADFAFNLERNLCRLKDELSSGSYKPGPYRLFTIYERKQRLIAAAPFRDRVVHHAAMRFVEPVLDRRFFYDSYACRKNKGVHRAVDRYQRGEKNFSDFNPSVQSWIGHAVHADSYGLRQRIMRDNVFIRSSGPNERSARASRGFLEQQTEEVAFRQPQQEPPCQP